MKSGHALFNQAIHNTVKLANTLGSGQMPFDNAIYMALTIAMNISIDHVCSNQAISQSSDITMATTMVI